MPCSSSYKTFKIKIRRIIKNSKKKSVVPRIAVYDALKQINYKGKYYRKDIGYQIRNKQSNF